MKKLDKPKKNIITISIIIGVLFSVGIPILIWKLSDQNKNIIKLVEDNRKVINDNVKLFNNFDQELNREEEPPKNGAILESDLEKLSGHDEIPQKIGEVERSFKITSNADTGIAIVEVSVKKGYDSGKISYTISGFKNTINDNVKLFNNFNQVLNKEEELPKNGAILESDLEKLGGHNEIPQKIGDIERSFKIASNANTGIAIVEVIFKKNYYSRKTSYKINGFASAINKQNQLNQKTIDAIADIDLPLPIDESQLPSSYSRPAKGVLRPSDVTYEFTRWDQDDESGTINWEAKLTKGTKSQRIISGEISELRTKQDQEDQETINKITNVDLPLPINKSNLPSSYPKPTKGVLRLSSVTYEFTRWDQDDESGTIHWEAKLTKGTKSQKIISGKIRELRTKLIDDEIKQRLQDQKAIDAIIYDDLPLPKDKSLLPSSYPKPAKGVLSPSNVAYEFTRWDQDDESGTIHWEAKLTKGTKSQRIIADNIGELATKSMSSETNQDRLDRETINAITYDNLPLPKDKSRLPTAYFNPESGILWPSGVEYEFIKWQQNDEHGSILWIVKLKKGKKKRTESKSIIGLRKFDTSSFADEKDQDRLDQATLDKVTSSDLPLPNDKSKLPSTYEKPPNGYLESRNVFYEFTDWEQNDESGTINWEAQLVKGRNLLKVISGTISGLESIDIVNELKQDYLNFKNEIKGKILEIKWHIDRELAKNARKNIILAKNNAFKRVITLKTKAKILEEKNRLVEQLKNLGNEYKHELVNDFKDKMTKLGYKNGILGNDFTIPEGIEIITESAFAFSTFPKNFQLPRSIKTIMEDGFSNAIFNSKIILPIGIDIKDNGFVDIDVPLGFEIPTNVKIAPFAFRHIKIEPLNRWVDKKGNHLNSKIPKPGHTLMKPPINEIKFLLESEFLEQNIPNSFVFPPNVKKIPTSAFFGATLPLGFNLPNGIVSIGANSFWSAKLPEGFTLANCKKLEILFSNSFANTILPSSFRLPNSLERISLQTFWESKINSGFNLPRNVSISAWAFKDAQLPIGFQIPISNTNQIEKDAFVGAQLPIWSLWYNRDNKGKEIWFANKIISKTKYQKMISDSFRLGGAIVKQRSGEVATYIAELEFSERHLPKDFKIPKTINLIKEGAFKNTNLPSEFVLPTTILEIQKEAFAKAKINANFQLSSNIILHHKAFFKSKLPNGFRIPNGATLNDNPFEEARLPLWSRWYNPVNSNPRYQRFSNFLLGFELKQKNKGTPTEGFAIKGSVIQKVVNPTFIDYGEFRGRRLGRTFVVPETVTIIAQHAFYKTRFISDFVLPSSVTEIRKYAFAGAIFDGNFEVPSTVVKIHSLAFLAAKKGGLDFRVKARTSSVS